MVEHSWAIMHIMHRISFKFGKIYVLDKEESKTLVSIA